MYIDILLYCIAYTQRWSNAARQVLPPLHGEVVRRGAAGADLPGDTAVAHGDCRAHSAEARGGRPRAL